MTIFSNLIQYTPTKNGFNTYINDVIPSIEGKRLIFKNGDLIFESNTNPLPKDLNLKSFSKFLHRYSFGQFVVNIKKLLEKSDYNFDDVSCIYCPITDYIFQIKDIPQIITCHDLTPLYFSTSFRQNFRFKYLIYHYFKKSSHIIAISKFAANQLIDIGIESSKITVIKNGVTVKRQKIKNKKSNNILVIARHDLNKNVEYILNTFLKLIDIKKSWDGNLIIVGRQGRRTKKIKSILNKSITSKVIFKENISNKELTHLIRNSMLLISSSYMEGFNYTILESMAEGLPTLVSDIEVHRELYKNQSLSFSLNDNGEELIKLILEVKNNDHLWSDLSEKGYSLANSMSTQNQQFRIKSLLENYKN